MSSPILWRGVLLDQATIDALTLAETLLGYELSFPQGSFNPGGVAASAGTHDGGGAVDVSTSGGNDPEQVQIDKVRALRSVGFAAWRRTAQQGFAPHIHCILLGDPLVSPAAAAQEAAWAVGADGLAGWAPDIDPVDVAAGRPPIVHTPPPVPRDRRGTEEELV